MNAVAPPRAEAVLAALMRAPAGMRVPDYVRRYVDKPGVAWKEKGRGWDGCDCWGLACLVYRFELGKELADYSDAYEARLLAREAGRDELSQLAGIIDRLKGGDFAEAPFEEARLLDLLLLPIAGEPCHITIYVGDLRVLHIEKGCNAVCEDLREMRWHGRLRHARMYRYVGGAA